MAWFKVDDKLHDHEKPAEAGQAAMGLWVMAGSWSADNLTDGFIPERVLSRWGRRRDADALVSVGLWRTCGEGWVFNDWEEYQPTGEEVKAKRLEARQRMATVRANKKRSSENVRVAPTRPDPTRPDHEDADASSSPAKAVAEPESFSDFWDAYGKKTGRPKSLTAFKAALKKPGVTSEVLIEAASEYVEWAKVEGKFPDFTKDPATWLRGEHWNDERSARERAKPRTKLDGFADVDAELAADEEGYSEVRRIGGAR